MSQPNREAEIDERLWDYYLMECRATGTKPDLSDFKVWASEQEFDFQEEPDVL